jgi:Dodecin
LCSRGSGCGVWWCESSALRRSAGRDRNPPHVFAHNLMNETLAQAPRYSGTIRTKYADAANHIEGAPVMVQFVGASDETIAEAVRNALARASRSLRTLDGAGVLVIPHPASHRCLSRRRFDRVRSSTPALTMATTRDAAAAISGGGGGVGVAMLCAVWWTVFATDCSYERTTGIHSCGKLREGTRCEDG